MERCSEAAFGGLWHNHNLAWIYGLAARVHKPLSTEASAQMHHLLHVGRHALADMKSSHDDRIPGLKVVMCIAGAYFRQDESMVGLCSDEYD